MTTPDGYVVDRSRRSWGRLTRATHYLARPTFRDSVSKLLQASQAAGVSVLGAGLGRSYGDSGLNADGALIDMTGLDRFICFNADTGVLRADAGVSLSDTLKLVAPRGWFTNTTPGTRFVTLGGAIANDVHGKNHHRAGAFGAGVRRLGLLRSDRGLVEIGPDLEPDLFAATVGGLGLTGLILWVELQLTRIPSAWLRQTTMTFDTVDRFFELADESEDAYEHTVAWIDCAGDGETLGRGGFTRANWIETDDRRVHEDKTPAILPVDLPGPTLNSRTVKAFNSLYYRRLAAAKPDARIHYSKAFYPLDALRDWNRMYGARGFYQYQSVIPTPNARDATRLMLEVVSKSGQGSFLAVLKTFGDGPSPGLLSFPMRGATLAMDFRNQGQRTLDLMSCLDDIVREADGRLYPAKDGRMSAEMFQSGYANWTTFAKFVDPAMSSSFWRRVSAS